MSSVLHMELVGRKSPHPLDIGFSTTIRSQADYNYDEDSDQFRQKPLFENTEIGCPLHIPNMGYEQTHIPFVRAIEQTSHPSSHGLVITDNLYLKIDADKVVPIQSRVYDGLENQSSTRYCHAPSLSAARFHLVGQSSEQTSVINPVPNILIESTMRMQYDKKRGRGAGVDWLLDGVLSQFSTVPIAQSNYDPDRVRETLDRISLDIDKIQSEVSPYEQDCLTKSLESSFETAPLWFRTLNPIEKSLSLMQATASPCLENLYYHWKIPTHTIPRLVSNPWWLAELGDVLDAIPKTDLNIEIIVDEEGEINWLNVTHAVNRFAPFLHSDKHWPIEQQIVTDLNPGVLGRAIDAVLNYHPDCYGHAERVIHTQAVKIKIIKTIGYEACILFYPAKCPSDEPPLLSVYFDFALQALAPMTMVPTYNPN